MLNKYLKYKNKYLEKRVLSGGDELLDNINSIKSKGKTDIRIKNLFLSILNVLYISLSEGFNNKHEIAYNIGYFIRVEQDGDLKKSIEIFIDIFNIKFNAEDMIKKIDEISDLNLKEFYIEILSKLSDIDSKKSYGEIMSDMNKFIDEFIGMIIFAKISDKLKQIFESNGIPTYEMPKVEWVVHDKKQPATQSRQSAVSSAEQAASSAQSATQSRQPPASSAQSRRPAVSSAQPATQSRQSDAPSAQPATSSAVRRPVSLKTTWGQVRMRR